VVVWHLFAIFEHDDSWKTFEVVFLRQFLVFVKVKLYEFDWLSLIFGSDLIEKDPHELAGTTPGCPEVDNDWLILTLFDDHSLELISRHFVYSCSCLHNSRSSRLLVWHSESTDRVCGYVTTIKLVHGSHSSTSQSKLWSIFLKSCHFEESLRNNILRTEKRSKLRGILLCSFLRFPLSIMSLSS